MLQLKKNPRAKIAAATASLTAFGAVLGIVRATQPSYPAAAQPEAAVAETQSSPATAAAISSAATQDAGSTAVSTPAAAATSTTAAASARANTRTRVS